MGNAHKLCPCTLKICLRNHESISDIPSEGITYIPVTLLLVTWQECWIQVAAFLSVAYNRAQPGRPRRPWPVLLPALSGRRAIINHMTCTTSDMKRIKTSSTKRKHWHFISIQEMHQDEPFHKVTPEADSSQIRSQQNHRGREFTFGFSLVCSGLHSRHSHVLRLVFTWPKNNQP